MKFWRNDRGGSAVEYAIVFTMLMALTFGAIDLGFIAFQWQGAVKAAQVGAREAVVMNRVASGLTGIVSCTSTTSCSTSVGSTAAGTSCLNAATGGPIDACNFGTVTCTNAACSSFGPVDTTSFNAILAQMQIVYPTIQASNVQITYAATGIGFVGYPFPATVTVSIIGMNYTFFGLSAFESVIPITIPLPPSPATLTGEDLKSS